MLGQIVWREDVTPLEIVDVLGLPILRGCIPREGRWHRRKLKKLLREFRRHGVRRLLVSQDFDDWALAKKLGFSMVDILPFLRRNSGQLLLLAMKKRGYEAENCHIALRATRVGRDMEMAANFLVHQVRDISISASQGGDNLGEVLRQHWGLGVNPDSPNVEGAIRFDQGGAEGGEVVLSLFGDSPELGGLEPNTARYPMLLESEWLQILAALWESGKLDEQDLEFYLT